MALSNCIATLKSSKEISPWLADDIDQALAARGRVSKKKALAAYIESAVAEMKAELEDIYDDVGIDAKDPLLGYEPPAVEQIEEDSGDIRYSTPRAQPWYYSALEEGVRTMPSKVSGTSAANVGLWLKSNADKLKIKKDEIEWSGVMDYLAGLGKEKVTADQLAEWVAENGVQVEEVVLGESDDFNATAQRIYGRNYDELLPPQKEKVRLQLDAYATKPKHASGNLVLPGGVDHREIVLTVPTIEPYNISDSTHYADVSGGKAIAWARVNTRTDANGNKVLFVEELQSQRSQHGREKGFKQPEAPITDADRMAAKEYFDVKESYWATASQDDKDAYVRDMRERKELGVPTAPFVSTKDGKPVDSYISLAMKRLVAYAVDTGHDSIAWTTGEQQADRYDLSKQVDAITYRKNTDGTFKASAVLKRGGNEKFGDNLTQSQLEEFVGKEIAAKIVAGEGEQIASGPYLKLSGLDLKVGGGWTASMYGNASGLDNKGKPSMIAAAAKKLGAEVGVVSIGQFAETKLWKKIRDHGYAHLNPEQVTQEQLSKNSGGRKPAWITDREWDKIAKKEHLNLIDKGVGQQPGFTITDSMRDQVQGKGMPLFSEKRLADDLAEQEVFLTDKAKQAGYKSIDDFAGQDIAGFLKAAEEWRDRSPAEVLESTYRAVDTESPEFKRWSRDLPVIGIDDSQAEEFKAGQGVVVQALHGTTGDFAEFKRQYAEIESDLGGGFYFTNTHDDAGNNYAGEGPDLTGKLEREAERQRNYLEDDDWSEGKTDDEIDNEAWRRARVALNVDSAGVSMPVYVRFENPVVLGGSNETFLDYNEEYNEELDEYGEPSGKLPDVIEALRDVTADERYGDIDVEQAIGSLMDEAYDGGISADRAIEILTSSKGLQYATDYEDERQGLANKEIVRKAFEQAGFDGFIDQTVNKKFGSEKRVGKPMAGMDQGTVHYIAFSPTQIKSAVSNTGEFSDTNPDIRETTARSQLTGQQIQNTWASPAIDKFDDFIRKMQDKMIDTKRVVEAIQAAGRTIKDQFDPYLQEILYHGRAAKAVTDFATNELKPLYEEMAKYKIDQAELGTYLWATHAPERNAQIQKINPTMANGSGMTDQQARDILAGQTVTINGKEFKIERNKMMAYRALGAKVKAINKGTTDLLVAAGLETQETVDAWRAAYSDYVPLMRDMEADDNFMGAFNLGMGTGQGFSVKGSASKRAMGSEREVIDIMANVAMQRERAITRAEKNRVAMAVYGMALQNPNTDFWLTINPDAKDPAKIAQVVQELIQMGVNPIDAQNIASEPKQTYIDPNTGMVASRINPQLRTRSDVLAVRINGKDRYVMFSSDARAQQMVTGLKNLDAEQLGWLGQKAAMVTRYFSAINTAYNPVFGLVNGMRDFSAAALNLDSTPLKGKFNEVRKYALPALRGIFIDLRDHRAGKQPTSAWAQEFEEFQSFGAQTGYRDMFATSKERADGIAEEIENAGKGQRWLALGEKHSHIFGFLSDYNTAIENAMRLSVYKAAKDNGISKERAAAIAKNITVNFNKRGQIGTTMGAYYAFFNAAVQGTARMFDTMFEFKGGQHGFKNVRLTAAGQKILYGGMALGVMQAVMGMLAGWDDDEPKEFERERNFIIPVPGSDKYIKIPMPLGFHVIPNIGRISTEFALGGFKDPAKHVLQLMGVFMEAFNPIGNAGISSQSILPTIFDPAAALIENRDWTGNSIYKEDFNRNNPTPGWTRAKDSASPISKSIAYWMNYLTGGGEFGRGVMSPTPDHIDYIVGQLTGGVGRDLILKPSAAIKSVGTGEELPIYKVPVLGKFAGETTGKAPESSRFYANLERIGEHKFTLDEMREKGRNDLRMKYLQEHKDARYVQLAEKIQREVGYLRRQKRALMERDAPRDQIRRIEDRITEKMRQFNERVNPRD